MTTEKFQYITSQQFPKLCLALSTDLQKIDDNYSNCKWVVSMKSPSDKFNKQLAREAIEQNRNKQFYSGEIVLKNNYSRYEIVTKILMSLAANDSHFSDTYKQFIIFNIYKNLEF